LILQLKYIILLHHVVAT